MSRRIEGQRVARTPHEVARMFFTIKQAHCIDLGEASRESLVHALIVTSNSTTSEGKWKERQIQEKNYSL